MSFQAAQIQNHRQSAGVQLNGKKFSASRRLSIDSRKGALLTAQEFQEATTNLGSTSTRSDFREFRFIERLFLAADADSVQWGLEHTQVHRNPHHACSLLVSAGILKKSEYLGSQPIFGDSSFKRAALKAPLQYLFQMEDNIKEVLFENGLDCDEMFNILCIASVNAATLGHNTLRGAASSELVSFMRRVPTGVAKAIGHSRDAKMRALGFEIK